MGWELVPGGETLKCGGEGMALTAWDPERKLFFCGGHTLKGELRGKPAMLAAGIPRTGSDPPTLSVMATTKAVGPITYQSNYGAVGTLVLPMKGTPVPVGEPELGPAVLRSLAMPGGEREIEICKVNGSCFDFLIEETIYKGMSGSPILQNGKLVGALWGWYLRSERPKGRGTTFCYMARSLLLGAPNRRTGRIEAEAWALTSDRDRARYRAAQLAVKGDLTAQEYEELIGEQFAVFARDKYEEMLSVSRDDVAWDVEEGRLTPEEYQKITGDEYVPPEEEET